jgi:hypothetical protein
VPFAYPPGSQPTRRPRSPVARAPDRSVDGLSEGTCLSQLSRWLELHGSSDVASSVVAISRRRSRDEDHALEQEHPCRGRLRRHRVRRPCARTVAAGARPRYSSEPHQATHPPRLRVPGRRGRTPRGPTAPRGRGIHAGGMRCVPSSGSSVPSGCSSAHNRQRSRGRGERSSPSMFSCFGARSTRTVS